MLDKDGSRSCVEKCPDKTFTDTTTDVWRCVASCNERFVDLDNRPRCVDTCPDEMFEKAYLYGSAVKTCSARQLCEYIFYYIAGDKNANTLAEKYDECVDECPPELPVHKEGEKQCMTCAAATDNKNPFW